MGLLDFLKSNPPQLPPPRVHPCAIPISPFDLDKRYDIYCAVSNEDRLYENVKLVGIRTFDRITEYSSGLIGGYLEIEASDGSGMLISSYGIQLICQHGTKPVFKVLKSWARRWEY